MNELYPGIRNYYRAQGGVGSSGIEHAHHLPRATKHDQAPAHEMPATEVVDEVILPVETREKIPRLKLLFRSAIRGIRGGEYDSAET